MNGIILASALGLVFVVCLNAVPTRAQSITTYVSSSGSNANDCASPATACASFSQAQSKTTNGGTIICLSSGSFFELTITKSITIDCRGHVAVIEQIHINQPDVVVILRGLHIYGYYSAAGLVGDPLGVDFTNGNALHIEDCKIAGVTAIQSNGIGLRFWPSGPSRLYVTDSVISENGLNDNSGGGGIFIQPTGSGSARVVLNRVTMNQNTLGIVVDGSGSSGRSVVEVNDSVVAGSIGNGITVNNAGMVINRTAVQGSRLGNGILAGPSALIHIGASTVAANALGGFAYNGGQILSYGDNKTKGNGVDNAPSGVLAPN